MGLGAIQNFGYTATAPIGSPTPFKLWWNGRISLLDLPIRLLAIPSSFWKITQFCVFGNKKSPLRAMANFLVIRITNIAQSCFSLMPEHKRAVLGYVSSQREYSYASFPRMRNMVVPQSGHVPFAALLSTPPFPFIGTTFASFICLFSLHFTQYPS